MPRHGGSHPRRRKQRPRKVQTMGNNLPATGRRLAEGGPDMKACRCGKGGRPCPIHP